VVVIVVVVVHAHGGTDPLADTVRAPTLAPVAIKATRTMTVVPTHAFVVPVVVAAVIVVAVVVAVVSVVVVVVDAVSTTGTGTTSADTIASTTKVTRPDANSPSTALIVVQARVTIHARASSLEFAVHFKINSSSCAAK
jgi:hypothetical protein